MKPKLIQLFIHYIDSLYMYLRPTKDITVFKVGKGLETLKYIFRICFPKQTKSCIFVSGYLASRISNVSRNFYYNLISNFWNRLYDGILRL